MDPGLYNQNNEISNSGVRIQVSENASNSVLVSEEFPTIVINLDDPDDKVSLEGLKFAHICKPSRGITKWPGIRAVKDNKYTPVKVEDTINTSILIKKGTLQLD